MSSSKLSRVVLDHTHRIMPDKNVPSFQRYVVVFLYADMRAESYTEIIRALIPKVRHRYVFDAILFKLGVRTKTKTQRL